MRDGRDNGYRQYERGHRRDRLHERDIQAELEDYVGQDSPESPHQRRPSRAYSRSPGRHERHRAYERRRSRTPSPRSRSRDRYSRRGRRGDSRSRSPGTDRGGRYKRRDDDDGDYRRGRWDDYGHRRDYRREDRGYYRGREANEEYRTREGYTHRRGDTYRNREMDVDSVKRKHGTTEAEVDRLPPPPPPPAELWPRSPNISAKLTSLAASQDLSFDTEKGIQDSGLLYSRLNHLAGLLLGPTLESWNEQEEECRLLRLKVGICVKNEDEKEPFSKDIIPDVYPNETCVDIPYEAEGNVNDPRSDFKKEYDLMSAWVMKPRPLPGFAEETLKREPESPTHSWSTSPKQIASNLERKSQRDPVKEERRQAARNTSLAPEFKPRRDNAEPGQAMELEEGYFNVKLIHGEDCTLQYGEIVDLIKRGELPDGWPAYRDVDSLWVSVSTKEEPCLGYKDGRSPIEIQKPIHDSTVESMIVEVTKEQDVKDIQPWIKDVSKTADKALKSKLHPVVLQYTRGEEHQQRDFDFAQEAKIASDCLLEHQRIISMRRNGRILAGTPKPVSPCTMAMIKGYVLSDRSKLRDIATGALQKALKTILEKSTTK